jgi:hypothetical protein
VIVKGALAGNGGGEETSGYAGCPAFRWLFAIGSMGHFGDYHEHLSGNRLP